MAIVCPSCDHEPEVNAAPGVACTACGAKLVKVEGAEALIGTIVDGRFEILAKLGEGGMGVVFRARQTSIDREIALKLLDRTLESDVTAVKRFFREAKVASKLAHPNTVQIIDFGQSPEGRLYIAMELVRGRTLHDEIIEQGALERSRVVGIGIQLCDAVEAAHALGIVHRDLKLENVMLIEGGRDHVKVLDFGLARSLGDPSMRATATGMISGTPRYMAPEVALGAREPTPAHDLYAVGVILGELASGRALFDAPTIPALFEQKLGGVDKVVALVPEYLRKLVGSLLVKEPATRPLPAAIRAALRTLGGENNVTLVDRAPPQLVATAAGPELVFPEQVNTGHLTPLDLPPVVKFAPQVPKSVSLPQLEAAEAIEPPALEVDADWLAHKKATQARSQKAADDAARAVVVARRRNRLWIAVGALLIAIAIAVVIYAVMHG